MRKNKSKSLSRYLAIQATFSQGFGFEKQVIERNFINKNDLNFHIDFENVKLQSEFDKAFLRKIFNNVFEKEKKISMLINQNLKSDWTVARLPRVLHAILKVAISEMITYPKTSIGIIASEYLKLAESFSIEKENNFINAILDKIHSKLKIDG
jgi:transcription antitermination factor NusB